MAESSDVVAWLDLLIGLADSIRERSDAPDTVGSTSSGQPMGCRGGSPEAMRRA